MSAKGRTKREALLRKTEVNIPSRVWDQEVLHHDARFKTTFYTSNMSLNDAFKAELLPLKS